MTELPASVAEQHTDGPQIPEPATLSTIAARVIHTVTSVLSSGDVAELRRLKSSNPFSPAFFKLMMSCVSSTGYNTGTAVAESENDSNWAAFFQVVALTAGLHNRALNLGEALARAGYSELRLFRLLRSQGDTLHKETRTCARFLASKGQSCDLTAFARILLTSNPDSASLVRKTIARGYYRFNPEHRET